MTGVVESTVIRQVSIVHEFKLDLRNGIVLCSELSESTVSSFPDVNQRDMKNGYVWYTLPIVDINGESVVFSLCFFNSRIQSLSISIANPQKYGSSWNDFSESKEKLRAKDTEKWLSSIGYQVGKYLWGAVWAGYDSKGGFGHAVVRYAL
ncbi:MAG: hypothetical protein Q8L72_02260 [Moraxellaceae bacterium]|nr:hypothetical protein [Moraxellaceae bacterium]